MIGHRFVPRPVRAAGPGRSRGASPLPAVFGLVAALAFGLAAGGCETGGPQLRGWQEAMITYEQAREIDSQIAWQSAVQTTSTGFADSIAPLDDIVVATETGANVVTALSARDGTDLWTEPAGDDLTRLLGVVSVNDDQVMAWTQSDCFVFDRVTGRLVAQQRYGADQVASTLPFVAFPFAIYGTPDGRVAYHHLGTGLFEAAYRLGTAGILNRPISTGAYLIVLTNAATVHAIDPIDNRQVWASRTLDPITTRPTTDGARVYLAGSDQSVWAFRASDGRLVWRYRTERPLVDDPTVLGDRLYQHVPGTGLVALDAETGREIWRNDGVTGGSVVTTRDGSLLVWQQGDGTAENPGRTRGSTMYLVAPDTGDVLGRIITPGIAEVAVSARSEGDVYGMARNGRVVKLIP